MFKWKIINQNYTDFLRQNADNRIPNTDYGKTKFKPFFGELFRVDDLIYVTQVTSPKPRHLNIRDMADFCKIFDDNNKLICCVNLNFMFPVPQKELNDLNYARIDEFISFNSDLDKQKYIALLKLELKKINQSSVLRKAEKLYYRKINKPDDRISMRCLDFKNLEQYALEWEKSQNFITV